MKKLYVIASFSLALLFSLGVQAKDSKSFELGLIESMALASVALVEMDGVPSLEAKVTDHRLGYSPEIDTLTDIKPTSEGITFHVERFTGAHPLYSSDDDEILEAASLEPSLSDRLRPPEPEDSA